MVEKLVLDRLTELWFEPRLFWLPTPWFVNPASTVCVRSFTPYFLTESCPYRVFPLNSDINLYLFNEVTSKVKFFFKCLYLIWTFLGEITSICTLPAYVLCFWCIFKKLNTWTLGNKNRNFPHICLLIYLNMHQGTPTSIIQNNSNFLWFWSSSSS